MFTAFLQFYKHDFEHMVCPIHLLMQHYHTCPENTYINTTSVLGIYLLPKDTPLSVHMSVHMVVSHYHTPQSTMASITSSKEVFRLPYCKELWKLRVKKYHQHYLLREKTLSFTWWFYVSVCPIPIMKCVAPFPHFPIPSTPTACLKFIRCFGLPLQSFFSAGKHQMLQFNNVITVKAICLKNINAMSPYANVCLLTSL